jgi:hypothetical protein
MERENPTMAEKFWKFILKNIVLEIVVAIVAGVIVAIISQEGRFDPTKLTPRLQPSTIEASPSTGIIDITPTPRINKLVTVDANVRWEDSGVTIHEGDLVKITHISGLWGGTSGISIDGWDCDNGSYSEGLMPTAPGSSLIAKIEDNMPFCVGASPVFVSQYSGNLYFSLNDCVSTGCFGDNSGSLVLKVVATSK